MNDIFNTGRFSRLFIKQLADNYRTYLMSLAVLAGIMLVGGSFLIYLIPEPLYSNTQFELFSTIYFLAGTIFTSTIFADVSEKKKAIGYLTLPASHFEKFFVGWLFSLVIFSLVYIGCFYAILAILVNLRHWPNQHAEMLNIFDNPFKGLFLIFFFLHSISIWGAVFFEKLHFIKTAFCFFIAVIGLSIINTMFIQALIGQHIMPATPFTNIVFYENGKEYIVTAVRQFEPLVGYLLIAISALFWLAAYYRLKEKQV